MSTAQLWTDRQVKEFAKSVRRRTGDAWSWMVPDVKRALASEQVLMVVGSLDRETVPVSAVHDLMVRLQRELGLRDD